MTCITVATNVSTGCISIDRALGSGLQAGSLSLIYGEAETGKTTLAMQCAVNCARQCHKTLFVDCDGTFSARRLSQLASEDFEQIAELIVLMKPNDFREQTTVTDQLPAYLTKNFGLAVFDTATSLYRVEVSKSPQRTFQLNRELNRQMALLAQTARTQKVAVLIISQVHSVLNNAPVSVEPVANRVLKFWADTVIAMRPTENSQIIRASLEKNREKAQLLTCNLKIEETGIHELH